MADKERIKPAPWPNPATSISILQLYFIDRKSIKEIAQLVNKSHQYISKEIQQGKRIIAQILQNMVESRRI